MTARFLKPAYAQLATRSFCQISSTRWRGRTTSDLLPFTKTSAAMPREL